MGYERSDDDCEQQGSPKNVVVVPFLHQGILPLCCQALTETMGADLPGSGMAVKPGFRFFASLGDGIPIDAKPWVHDHSPE